MAAISPAQARGGAFGKAVTVALVLLAAWLAAYWTWVFLTPPRVAPAAVAGPGVDLAAVARLFGAAPPATGASRGAGALKLKGVVAPTPGSEASAIFSTGSGRDSAVYIGNEVEPGLRLAEVHPDHVIVTRAGVSGRIDLEAPRSSAGTARGPAGRTAPAFRLNVARTGTNTYALSRKELDDALRDPGQLNHLGSLGVPPKGGVRMESAPPGSLAQKLGLQAGDVIRKLNGQTVASTGDLARLYTQFATLSLIQAEVQRGQSVVQLSYAIQP